MSEMTAREMGKKRYFYHVTKPENVGDIIKFGLMRSKGGRTTFAVYLSENPIVVVSAGT